MSQPTAKIRGGGGRELELAFEEFGDPCDPALLLVMGLGGQMVMWHDDFCRLLAGRGFRVIRFDNRDVGLSSKLDEFGTFDLLHLALRGRVRAPAPAPYSLDDMADDALSLLDVLGIARAHVVGASMGGMIAQCMVLRAPERVASLCSWMSSTSDMNLVGFDLEIIPVMLRPAPMTRAERIEHGVAWYRAIGSPDPLFDEATVRELVGRAFDRSPYVRGFSRQLAAVLAGPPRGERLARADVPTVVIHGSEDPLVPPSAGRHTARVIPGAFLELVPGLGHDMPPSLWRRFADVIHHNAWRADKRTSPEHSRVH